MVASQTHNQTISDQPIVISDVSPQELQVRYELALKEEALVQQRLEAARLELDRLTELARQARRKETEARSGEEDARRRIDTVQRREDPGKNDEAAISRLEREALRLEGEAKRIGYEITRWEHRGQRSQRATLQRGNIQRNAHEQESLDRVAEKANRRVQELRVKLQSLERRASDARRRADAARRDSQPQNRKDDGSELWERQLGYQSEERRRHAAQVSRHERTANAVAAEIRDLEAQLTNWTDEVQALEPGMGLNGHSAPGAPQHGAPGAFTVTARSLETLSAVLKQLSPMENQALRLSIDEQGIISLLIDTPNETDRVLAYHGAAVLLVAYPLPPGLTGKILDATLSSGAPSLVVY